MDPWRSNIGGPDPCDPFGVDAYDNISTLQTDERTDGQLAFAR